MTENAKKSQELPPAPTQQQKRGYEPQLIDKTNPKLGYRAVALPPALPLPAPGESLIGDVWDHPHLPTFLPHSRLDEDTLFGYQGQPPEDTMPAPEQLPLDLTPRASVTHPVLDGNTLEEPTHSKNRRLPDNGGPRGR